VLQIVCIDAIVDDPILVKLIVTDFHETLESLRCSTLFLGGKKPRLPACTRTSYQMLRGSYNDQSHRAIYLVLTFPDLARLIYTADERSISQQGIGCLFEEVAVFADPLWAQKAGLVW